MLMLSTEDGIIQILMLSTKDIIIKANVLPNEGIKHFRML